MLELAAIAVAAFFVASGVGELVAGAAASELPAPGVASGSTGARAAVALPVEPETARLGGSEILSRNIFDSVVGPLAGDGARPAGDPDRRRSGGGDEIPGEVRPCADDQLELLATVRSELDPSDSFALLGLDGGRGYCGVGDEFAGRRVEAIGWRYVLLSDQQDRRCYLDLHDGADAVRRQNGKGSSSI